mmetsp:Transcript_37524/g.85154  ORF Transcript_37524/g.85154 Transcript_37524/m.85154 type:complete len:194 (-) Transcript_37524:259-840(-)
MNHSPRNECNCEVQVDGRRHLIWFVAKRIIQVGEELTYNYGPIETIPRLAPHITYLTPVQSRKSLYRIRSSIHECAFMHGAQPIVNTFPGRPTQAHTIDGMASESHLQATTWPGIGWMVAVSCQLGSCFLVIGHNRERNRLQETLVLRGLLVRAMTGTGFVTSSHAHSEIAYATIHALAIARVVVYDILPAQM